MHPFTFSHKKSLKTDSPLLSGSIAFIFLTFAAYSKKNKK